MSKPTKLSQKQFDRIGKALSDARITIREIPVGTTVTTASAEEEAQAFKNQNYDHLGNEEKKAKIQTINESNRDARVNRLLRWKYAKWVFCYLVSYSVFVGVILVFSGWKLWGFRLAPEVLSFLTGSTAAAAIGLVYAVTNGLFGNNKH